MAYFLSSDAELPLTHGWSETSPRFWVAEPRPDELERVRRNLTLQHIRYVGAHTGCGCGFRAVWGNMPEPMVDDAAAAQSDHDAFAAYLRALPLAPMQLYACWSGDEAEPPEHRRSVHIAELVWCLLNNYTTNACFARWIFRRISSPFAFQV